MNIQLKPETAELIQAYIATGHYTNADDVIIKALKLLSEWEKEYQEWERETHEKLAVGLAQIERGEVVNSDVIMPRLEAKIRIARENEK
ncbi:MULTISPECIES: type II toxin-antitoxin system ParD family antitoxin [unclassified Anabaena]|uniref:ribbon-helix-helix domain-containing protein n=1 Tax=unclassified Anabaena TaxID=2619674 RepID=UPI001447C4D4|nr:MULTISPECIES: type II toxin-antitoxin system ParD family antitoxin [unclassified Anabaena]MTJ09695.1 type II toxin-antitoxin system ParD family antitoxin [Anabaena sp. UHCC 0204]MTJ54060.1 type II toxin-antitoxin system ParD family antitoxin [Anabaena sp. UHCC 0253]